MIAQAPGKVVISGAYAVLEGAPAIVSAVDRYATADSRRPAERITPELRAAIGTHPAPWFDASALREGDHKLGLGSSAAILIASLAALALEARGPLDPEALCAAVLEPALQAHARAQGGGSGIDVAASARGGTLIAQRQGDGQLRLQSSTLPASLHLEVWTAGRPASTPALLGRVRELESRDPRLYGELMGAQKQAAVRAAEALERGRADAIVEALTEQCERLARLGEAAAAPIVIPEVRRLAEMARRESAAVLPSGAGGGDVVLFAGLHAPSASLTGLARELGHRRLDLSLHAPGVHAVKFD